TPAPAAGAAVDRDLGRAARGALRVGATPCMHISSARGSGVYLPRRVLGKRSPPAPFPSPDPRRCLTGRIGGADQRGALGWRRTSSAAWLLTPTRRVCASCRRPRGRT